MDKIERLKSYLKENLKVSWYDVIEWKGKDCFSKRIIDRDVEGNMAKDIVKFLDKI